MNKTVDLLLFGTFILTLLFALQNDKLNTVIFALLTYILFEMKHYSDED